MSQKMQTVIANLRWAERNRTSATIGGGEFDAETLGSIAAILERTERAEQDAERYKHAREAGAASLASIREMVKAYEEAETAEDEEKIEEARRTIEEDPLSVQIRSGWMNPGDFPDKAEANEFEILLCTGGPAVRIVGRVGMHGEVDSDGYIALQHQDWFLPWVDAPLGEDGAEVLRRYASFFYYGG